MADGDWSMQIGLVVITMAVLVGSSVYWVPLPSPGYGLVEEIAEAKLPNPRNLTDFCSGSAEDGLHGAVRLFEGKVEGSESVAVDPGGRLVMLDKYGYMHVAQPASTPSSSPGAPSSGGGNDSGPGYVLENNKQGPVAYLGPGRPLAFEYDAEGNLLVCDSLKGLVMVEHGTNRVVLLTSRVSDDSPLQPGSLLSYANALAIAKNGDVYFSDSSAIQPIFNRAKGHWDTLEAYHQTMLKGEPSGRLLRYRPSDGSTHVLAQGLWYSNGVALSQDESFVAVVETCSLTVHRLWLKGDKAGSMDVLVDRLPGFPDGLALSSDGGFWVALLVKAPPADVMALFKYKLLRLLQARLHALRVPLQPFGALAKISPEGQVVNCLLDTDGSHVAHVSAVTERGNRLYLGNLVGNYVSYIDLS